jgi:hypothetical protein
VAGERNSVRWWKKGKDERKMGQSGNVLSCDFFKLPFLFEIVGLPTSNLSASAPPFGLPARIYVLLIRDVLMQWKRTWQEK